MGTINYGSSGYITLGTQPLTMWDIEQDSEFIEELQQQADEYNTSLEHEIMLYLDDCQECDYMNAKSILDKYNFWYFNVALKPGYYDGYYIDIESNFQVAFDNWQDRRDAHKEVTQLKNCLIELAGVGFLEVWPGWVTHYKDYETTLKSISEVAKAMRADVDSTPTWNQYNRAAGY